VDSELGLCERFYIIPSCLQHKSLLPMEQLLQARCVEGLCLHALTKAAFLKALASDSRRLCWACAMDVEASGMLDV